MPLQQFHIKPKQEYVKKFFDGLNDFQSIILSQWTNPRYTSNFKLPKINSDQMLVWRDNQFIWNTPDGYNLDIESIDFQNFVNKLISQQEDFDKYKTDNMYRMLTHDAIKNLDVSMEREVNLDVLQKYFEGGEKIAKLLRIYGREYDEIKKYIHGIEIMNNLTYDEKDNYPDDLLKVNIEYEGWKPMSLTTTWNKNVETTNLYYGFTMGYTAKEMESEFYRRLLMNSNFLARHKGTKYGMEMMLNLFGINREHYTIEEYVYAQTNATFPLGNNTPNMPNMFGMTTPNSIKQGFHYIVNNGQVTYDGITYIKGEDFYGNPCSSSITGSLSNLWLDTVGSIGHLNGFEDLTMMGIQQWQDDLNQLEGGTIDANEVQDDLQNLCMERYYYGDYKPCYGCNGIGIQSYHVCPVCEGTGKIQDCLGVPQFKKNSERLYYQQNGGWYKNTATTIRTAESLSKLLRINQNELTEGDVYYVNKLSYDDSKPRPQGIVTNYFILLSISAWNTYAGWSNVTVAETNSTATRTLTDVDGNTYSKTIDMQSLIHFAPETQGNNPHQGEYDGGLSYLQNIGTTIDRKTAPDSNGGNNGLFKYVLDGSPFRKVGSSYSPRDQYENLKGIGFTLQEKLDTKKCWWVGNSSDNVIATNTYSVPSHKRGSISDLDDMNHYSWENGNNTRTVENYNYPWYQMVNVKRVKLEFTTKPLNTTNDANGRAQLQEYYNIVMNYVEEMVSQDAIFEFVPKF